MLHSNYNKLTTGAAGKQNTTKTTPHTLQDNFGSVNYYTNSTTPVEENSDVYRDTGNTLNIFKESETKDLDKTN